ncbi:cell adhesion molecule 4-like [Anneissia japonica]|uniref:cell adhesion molecule 4-like n=1 Tax=Anneissia japonica TaxID=1529436 RepID=UPI00142577AA|nr:cell adhesion molecule 4-like [Anneissia japonica]
MCTLKPLLVLLHIFLAQAVRFTGKPKNVQQFEGQTTRLKCILGDFDKDKHTVSWMKGETRLSRQNVVTATDMRISVYLDDLPYVGAYTYLLIISDLVLEDEGGYHCQIDQISTISSGIAYLTVLQVPSSEYPKCTKSANSYVVGLPVQLTCVSVLISPPVDLNWNRHGSPISSMSTQTETRDGLVYEIYTFTAKKTDNDDTFMCQQRTDVLSYTQNCTIQNLNIQYRPEVKIQHTSAIFAGSDSILFCQSFAIPPVTVFRWTFTPVFDANEYIADGQVLTLIKPSMARNATRITCSAENNIGISTDTMTLHITEELRRDNNIQKDGNDFKYLPETKGNNMDIFGKGNPGISLYVVIIIIVLVVIIVVVVVIIPVYYHCFCKTRTATDNSGREIYQPTVFYDTRDRTSGLYDRSLPHLPSTGHYGHWRHSFASQVPEDLDQQGYMYIEERNGQNTL